MATLKARLEKLEGGLNGPARQIVIKSHRSMTDYEVSTLLAADGIEQTQRDLIVHIRTFYEGVDPSDLPPPEVLNVTSLRA